MGRQIISTPNSQQQQTQLPHIPTTLQLNTENRPPLNNQRGLSYINRTNNLGVTPATNTTQQYSQKNNIVTQILEDQTIKDENAYLNIEKKRIEYIQKLSLAQRLGIVEKPPLPLSQGQWKDVEKQSLKRFNEKEPCPICYEELRFQEQSILSCSHVFHKTCLESFEKFMKNKQADRYCPLCRKKDYDRKHYVEGQKTYLLKCIFRIQGLVKGFLARNAFYTFIKDSQYQPKVPTLKKKFIGFKLSRIGKKQRDQMNKDREGIVNMVQKLDKNIKDTEALLQSFMPNVTNLLRQKLQVQQKDSGKDEEEQKLSQFWQNVKKKAIIRAEKDCPICYNSYFGRENYLLDCTHVYHRNCLESFERFDFSEKLCCPMCRHPNYQKILIKM